jgi:hypothetical protein
LTVGSGFAPDLRLPPWKDARGLARRASITAGGDFHPALRADVLLMSRAPLSRESALFLGISGLLRPFPAKVSGWRLFRGQGIKKLAFRSK